jgi:hypothetical protein
MDANEKLARQIYAALHDLVKDPRTTGLLAAVADTRQGLSFDQAAPKTQVVFRQLAENLTREQGK